MATPAQHRIWIFSSILPAVKTTLAIAAMFTVTVVVTQSTQAQTFAVLHTFTGGRDGGTPLAGLTLDRSGNLYGTTADGGTVGPGTVFKLTHNGSGWTLSPLYSFTGASDGANPEARVIFGPNGTLYGTTTEHTTSNWGGVFNLRPSPTRPVTVFAPWNETVIHRFAGPGDGANPLFGDVVFDQTGNLYGTTGMGGTNNTGSVYEMTPAGGGWTEKVLYSFGVAGGGEGSGPSSGVIFDNSGNLYGTTFAGGPNNFGVVFELTPSGGGWAENTLYRFSGGTDGGAPLAGLVLDSSGNLYGATSVGGSGGGGTVFVLSPSNGAWTFNVIYSFTEGEGPAGTLAIDAGGNLYGTTQSEGAYGYGSVFELSPGGGGWSHRTLHDFCSQGPPCSDGAEPFAGVTLDANGNLYGTTQEGGTYIDCCGVVFEIVP